MKALGLAALALTVAGLGCGGDDGGDACAHPGGARCDGDTIVYCGGAMPSRDCGDEGLSCGYVDVPTGFSCVADPCAAVGPQGRCTGDILDRCTDGQVTSTTCGDGQVCGYVDDTTGYGCLAAAGPMQVQGEVRYEDRAQTGRGGLATTIEARPVRGAQVTVINDATMAVLATGVTADNGSYVLRFDAPAGTMVHVTAISRSTLSTRPILVVNSASAVHGFPGQSFPAASLVTSDLLVTEASGAAQAMNVFDETVRSMDALTGKLGVVAPTPLRLFWQRGSNDGTYFDGSSIHLLGASSDDDGYDDTVIQHEIGHYVEHTVGRSDSPGGGHNGSPTDARLAWSEGYATYWAQSTLGQPIYSDSNSGGGFFDNLETGVTRATGTGLSQQVSENMVSEILWDLGDGGASDDDPANTEAFDAVNAVQPEYLHAVALRAVGVSGVDLVDFLDGWFVEQGLASCAAVRTIVTTTRNFPYDYAGPGGACP